MVTFGDSYSDDGNVYRISNHTWPISAYYHGEFSNGPIWPILLSETLHAKAVNYAYGSATSDNKYVQGASGATSNIPVPGLAQQVKMYSKKSSYASTALHTVAIIGNDLYFNPNASGKNVANNVLSSLGKLYDIGARHFLVLNTVPLGSLPAVTAGGPDAINLYSSFANEYNKQLVSNVGHFKVKYPKASVSMLDVYKLFKSIENHQTMKSLSDTTDACLVVNGTMVQSECKNPQDYLFWDTFHPTKQVHALIAKKAYAALQ